MEGRILMTQIYGTLGPACASQEMLEAMLRNGLTGMRLNLSHCDLADSRELLEAFLAAAKATGTHPQLLIDMQGPELRIGAIASMELVDGAELMLGEGGIEVPAVLFPEMKAGDELLLDDGKLALEVLTVAADRALTRVVRGGKLTSSKSIKLTGKDIRLPVSTERDIRNIRQAADFGVTTLMQPFVHSGEDLVELRRILEENGAGFLKIHAKIETVEGAHNLDSILPHADAIVIARGDLGNDMPLWQLPGVQKDISAACRKAGKPFVVVNQMLASMERNPIPTRTEVSDIFNAVADGAYGVMLTNETAVGAHPVEAVSYMASTAADAERWLRERN